MWAMLKMQTCCSEEKTEESLREMKVWQRRAEGLSGAGEGGGDSEDYQDKSKGKGADYGEESWIPK